LNDNLSIEIYDFLGALKQTSNLSSVLSKYEGARIDISNLATGIYFVKICTRVEKFVKL